MNAIKIVTHFNIEIEFAAPPFGKRLLAWLIDLVVQIFYIIVATRFFNYISPHLGDGDDSYVTIWAISLLLLLPVLLYHVVMEATMNGQSIGKKLMRIKVVSENGGRPSLGQLIIRWLVRTSDYTLVMIVVLIPTAEMFGAQVYWGIAGGVSLFIVDLILVNSKKQQRLGDVLAHTILINTRQTQKIADTVFLEVSDSYVPKFPEVMRLSDRDMNTLKSIIDNARKFKDPHMAKLAADKIKRHLNIQTQMPSEEFLEVLMKDYNYLSIT